MVISSWENKYHGRYVKYLTEKNERDIRNFWWELEIFENITNIYEKDMLCIIKIFLKSFNEIKHNALTNYFQKSQFQK